MDDMERKQEGWVKFTRYHCREGFIDCYTGDVSHNPNADHQPRYQLNSIKSWVRLNGEGEWKEPATGYSEIFDKEIRAENSANDIYKAMVGFD